jgi:translation initiation factor 2 subunit 1
MFFKKKGLPEVGETVLCTVKRITPHGAFVSIDEYDNKEAMLHISEVSTKWVKNIREFVTENKKVVCKVLQKNEEKGYVDVSLKRVSHAEAQAKMNEIKTEMRIEKLIEVVAKKIGEDPKKALDQIGSRIVEQYETLSDFYTEVRNDLSVIDKLDINEKWKHELNAQIAEQIKTQQVSIKKALMISSIAPDGIERIKLLAQKMKEFGKSKSVDVIMKYLSSPKYMLEIKVQDYKTGESFLKKLFEQAESLAKKSSIEFSVKED